MLNVGQNKSKNNYNDCLRQDERGVAVKESSDTAQSLGGKRMSCKGGSSSWASWCGDQKKNKWKTWPFNLSHDSCHLLKLDIFGNLIMWQKLKLRKRIDKQNQIWSNVGLISKFSLIIIQAFPNWSYIKNTNILIVYLEKRTIYNQSRHNIECIYI